MENYTVKLGQYTGIEIPDYAAEATEKEIEAFLQNLCQRSTKKVKVDAPAVLGNIVVIDYAGFIGDLQFEGGTSSNYPLELGSGSFIPGFEDQLVGASAGETVDVKVTFPAQYPSKEVAGKEAVFHCIVHEVQEKKVPELNDDLAREYRCESVKDLQKMAYDTITKQKTQQNLQKVQETVIEQIVANSEITVSDEYVQKNLDRIMVQYRQQIAQQGASLEDYLHYIGMSEEQFRNQLRPQAEAGAKATAVLAAIAEAEHITVTDEEIEQEINEMARAYQMRVEDIKAQMTESIRAEIFSGMLVSKTIEFVMESAIRK